MAEHREPAVGRTELPLHGIRDLDVASFLAAPVAATVLGDYGADVVKVEPLHDGDANRLIAAISSGYRKSAVNYPWHLASRGKRSLAIDLKNARVPAAFDRPIASADLPITNYPRGSCKRLRPRRDFAHWRSQLKDNGIAFAAVSRAEDFSDDEQAVAAGILVATANPEMPRTIAAPLSIAGVEVPPAGPGPQLGAHSADVLREAGIGAEEIAALTTVVACAVAKHVSRTKRDELAG
jgi:crotonobetainyl-CoA:carnitine CoA-transferase CaiB-like acyl-CoA transferase